MVEVAAGVRLHVRCWCPSEQSPGQPSARPYLLVHGLASNARTWDGVAARLAAAGHPAVAVDLRGHGESDQPADGYDTRTAAADLATLCDVLRLAGPVLAGQSWGGNVVLELAASHPGRASALALLDGGWIHLGDIFATWEECWAALAPPRFAGLTRADIRHRLLASHPDWPTASIDGTLANLTSLPDGSIRARLTRDRHADILRSLWAHRPRELYRLVDIPTLLLPAGASGSSPLVAEAAARLPRAEVRWYDGADHDLHAQHPDRVAADLESLP